jgi:hypothetical protein
MLARLLASPRLDRIASDVADRPKEAWPVLDESGLEAALEKVAHATMTAVEPLSVDGVDVMHARREVGIRRPHQEVVVVSHQTEGEQRPRLSTQGRLEYVEEAVSVFVVPVDRATLVPASEDVVDPAGELQSRCAGDEVTVTQAVARPATPG